MSYDDPCCRCWQAPATCGDYCLACSLYLKRSRDVLEPDCLDDDPSDEASDRAQAAWERYYHGDE